MPRPITARSTRIAARRQQRRAQRRSRIVEQEANGFAPAAQKIDDIDVDVAEIEAATAALAEADQTINTKLVEFDTKFVEVDSRLDELEDDGPLP